MVSARNIVVKPPGLNTIKSAIGLNFVYLGFKRVEKKFMYAMKKIFGFLFATVLLFSLSSCYTSHPRHGSNLPPGQAKKIYGGKSAKRYAPGQQKKKKGKHKRKHHDHRAYHLDVYMY